MRSRWTLWSTPLTIAATLSAIIPAGAAAHGLLVSIRGRGDFIVGKVYYSNGEIGAGQYVELSDLDKPGAKPQTGKTDPAGAFRFRGVAGHRYRFLTEGEEGHQTEMRITLADGSKGRFIDRDAIAPRRAAPAWLVIGAALAGLTGIVLWRRRDRIGSPTSAD